VTDAEEPTPAALADEHPPRPARWKLTLVIGAIIGIQAVNYIASASVAYLVNEHPLWLVLMQPTTRNLLFVSDKIFWITFFVITILRRQVPHPLWFLIGRWYGEPGLRWVSKRFPEVHSLLQQVEGAFPRWGWLVCILYPHPAVCALAGASKMRFVPFLVYTFIGIIGFVSLAYFVGDWLTPVTHPILDFSKEYVIPLTALTVALTAFAIWRAFRADKLESIGEMERELDEEAKKEH
jgi:membrane protein DedA with SNARE-associated domain